LRYGLSEELVSKVVKSFVVTEVYIKEDDTWKMDSLTFSHLLRPVKMKKNDVDNNNQH